MNLEENPEIVIPMPNNPITITPQDMTIEKLQLKFPDLSERQLTVVAENLRKQFAEKFGITDFESKC